jgi:thiamine-phosphate pyrophosphorylase
MDRSRLRLVVITDRSLARPRDLVSVVESALRAGAPCIQLREKRRGVGEIMEEARELRRITRAHGALLIVNDRVDLALGIGADGVHLGPDDLPVAAVRRVAPPGFLIGYSTDDPGVARRAVQDGADYLGCGAVWPTGSKEDAGEAVGPEGVARVARAVSVPVVAIGGVTVERIPLLRDSGAAGVAVIGAVMGAAEPGEAVAALLAGLGRGAGTRTTPAT